MWGFYFLVSRPAQDRILLTKCWHWVDLGLFCSWVVSLGIVKMVSKTAIFLRPYLLLSSIALGLLYLIFKATTQSRCSYLCFLSEESVSGQVIQVQSLIPATWQDSNPNLTELHGHFPCFFGCRKFILEITPYR